MCQEVYRRRGARSGDRDAAERDRLPARRCPTRSSRSSSASCRPTSCPTTIDPKEATHDRASDPHRPPAPERQRRHRADRSSAEHRGRRRGPRRARRASRPATRSRPGRSPRASRCASTTRSSASRAPTSRPASTSTPTTSRCRTSPATTRSAPTSGRPRFVPGGRAGELRRASCAPSGKAGTRNFIGVLSTVNCSATVCHHVAETFPKDELAAYRQRRRHRRADPRHRLRHGRSRRGLRDAAAHALGLCPPSQLRRRADDRPRLRGQPDRFPARGLSDPARAAFSHHDHAGHRRHAQDDRARAGDDPRDAAARQRGAAPADLGLARSRSRCSAAARTPIPASPRTRRSAPAPTSWCATAAPRSCPRRPRSTAPSTC